MRTRIAPSPTGFMHIGTARTALFNWIVARATAGNFILRMDDTDTERNIEAAEQPIFDGLKWMGLDWDEFYRQSTRGDVYRDYAHGLVESGHAFYAENGAVILKGDTVPDSWSDEVGGVMSVSQTMKDEISRGIVLLRGGDKNGQATYQFASILDDYLMRVNFIIRGVDHIANTSKQLTIWNALTNYAPPPKFAHVGLIFANKKKMSKRDGAASLLDYRDKGYDPDALFQFLTRLGWGPSVDDKSTTFLTREQTLDIFLSGGRMRASNANFDMQKLDWYDRTVKKRKK